WSTLARSDRPPRRSRCVHRSGSSSCCCSSAANLPRPVLDMRQNSNFTTEAQRTQRRPIQEEDERRAVAPANPIDQANQGIHETLTVRIHSKWSLDNSHNSSSVILWV